jgi:membrane-associated phospholipid phosphatase
LVIAICAYVFVLFPLRKKKQYARTVFHDIAPALTATASVVLFKWLLHVDRPFVTLGLNPFVPQPDPHGSFPSWHVAVLAAFALTLVFHHRKLGVFLLALLPIVMIGRMAIGVHWFTDVIGGAAIGLMIAFRFYWRHHGRFIFLEKIANKIQKRRSAT